jgi:uroporphyrinogen III methyltransferase/synthase
MSISSRSSEELLNRKILVACSAKKMLELVTGLKAMGGEVLPLPVIEIREIEDMRPLDRALSSLTEYAWIIFTSTYGVSYFMERMGKQGMSADIQKMPKICAIGPATASAVRENGHEVALIPKQFVAEGVVEALATYYGGIQNLSGRRILLPRALEAREHIPEALKAAGARIDVVPCYRTVCAEIEKGILQKVKDTIPDLIIFTSSSTIRNFINILGLEPGRSMLRQSTVAALGPVTKDTAESFGKCAEIVPGENTVSALLAAIRDYYSSRQ